MPFHASKLRIRRKFRKRQNQVENLSEQAESVAERYFFRRLEHLTAVRRFVIAWLLLFVLLAGSLVGQIRALDGYFQSLQPIPGGVYTEGILGDFTNANPLYATNDVDSSISKLLFASLFTFDDDNNLVGDLAEAWTVDETAKIYTVTLRPNLTWHDGTALTSRDVVYTYKMIQDPNASSPLFKGWQGITIAAVDPRTVTFTLPNVLGSFPYNMTNGIIPYHILKDTPASELRASTYNTTRPVGSGPFKWEAIEVSTETPDQRQEIIEMKPFENYHAGAPKLNSFVVRSFPDPKQLEESFLRKELTAASFDSVPKRIKDDPSVLTNSFLLSAANMVFFRQSNPVLADLAVRKSLVQAVDVQKILSKFDYPTYPVRQPFLIGQLGYDPNFAQLPPNPGLAAAQLDAAGWKVGADGIRAKAGQALRFTLNAPSTSEARLVTNELARAWKDIGAQAVIRLQTADDLQRVIAGHEYDALLYGISVGPDPDVFVYWHSSQIDARSNRLNFSEWKSRTADASLEAGRTRIESNLRSIKYKPLLQAWQQEAPALGLYQPRYIYVTRSKVDGLNQRTLNTDIDRFSNVVNWQIRQSSVTNSP